MKFKKGNTVVCIDNGLYIGITIGKKYKIIYTYHDRIIIRNNFNISLDYSEVYFDLFAFEKLCEKIGIE